MNLSPLNGIRDATSLFDRAATTIASGPESTGDLIGSLVDVDQAPLAVTVNERVLEAQDAMTRSLLDLRA